MGVYIFLPIFMLMLIHGRRISGLNCWGCSDAHTNKECLLAGSIVHCKDDHSICEDQVRQGEYGYVIEKRCKQRESCYLNVVQNTRSAFHIQCNLKSPTSKCTCCCDSDLCNVQLLACWNEIKQFDPRLPKPTCKMRPKVPDHANMQCTGNLHPGTKCKFECHDGYFLAGSPTTTCLRNLTWDKKEPECIILKCSHKMNFLKNGNATCSERRSHRSRCEYTCRKNFMLVGHKYTLCTDAGRNNGTVAWTSPVPYCKPISCPEQVKITNGEMVCSRKFKIGSVCSFRCEPGYDLYPKDASSNRCARSGAWSSPTPCCTPPCPPNVVMDFIVVMDSSSSVGEENWMKMKKFVRSFLNDFTAGKNAAQYGVFRYNKFADTTTQILLTDHPNNKNEFLEAYDRIPYGGSGTGTDNALNHTVDVLLKVGNRPEARDVVLLITDGVAHDDVTIPARRLRKTGSLVYVLPVMPQTGWIDLQQIEDIVGPGNDRRIIKAALGHGFEALNVKFAKEISEILCSEPCYDPFTENTD
ncbi:E-selectin-like isoform X2 [Clavelina lepadiformis]|uniref:E-selectin-like isoform X2 n=1 Tax=Clavelina lepadiformis TaxID=159417 RepID=UPI004041626E